MEREPRNTTPGSSTLTSTLLEHGLADEVLPVVYPVLPVSWSALRTAN